MTADKRAEAAEVEAVLALLPPCGQCGKAFSDRACGIAHAIIRTDPLRHRLIEPLLARRLAEARAEALREAADRWTQGAWSNVMLPKPAPPAVPVIAYANRFGDWLRAAAEQAQP